MNWAPDNLRTKGALATFHQALDKIPIIWDKHCFIQKSTTNQETYSFPGFVPEPRLFLNSRQFRGMRDFTFNLENFEYELSMIINRKHWEDDQTGLINARMSEMAEVWGTFKDSLFTTHLANGNVAGSTGWDGVVFHGDSRTIGDSGTIDNNISHAAATGTTLTTAEWITMATAAREALLGFNDDTGRPFNVQAISNLRFICHPDQFGTGMEAMKATLIGGGNTNVLGPALINGIDELPYMASADSDEIFVSALGSSRKPFIMQERMPLEVIMLTDANNVALHNGVLVLTRERFRLGYGEPRRSVLVTVT